MLLQQRHQAGVKLVDEPPERSGRYPEPAFDRLPDGSPLPGVAAAEVTPELVRAGLLRNGCLLVRGLLAREDAARLVEGIDRAYAAREDASPDPEYFAEFETDGRFQLAFDRGVLRGGAGLLAADSPKVAAELLDALERASLPELVSGYLGEPYAISINKCLLRKVSPDLFEASTEGERKPSAWHQDGAFMGEVRALNLWLALNRCGDEAPGLDVVPRRLDEIVATGTEGAAFDWSVSREVAEQVAGEAGIVRPVFDAGDALLFDELFLHATAAEPEMPNMRYAVESWFFGASAFPEKYAPLAV